MIITDTTDTTEKKVFITNYARFHYEIIESVIQEYRNILHIHKDVPVKVFLNIPHNTSFVSYITTKYPDISLSKPKSFDFCIHCTIYNRDFNSISKYLDTSTKYIAHEITERLEKNPNVFFLTPLARTERILNATFLPFQSLTQREKPTIPIYIIQGNMEFTRRNYYLLVKILETTFKFDFKIKMIGGGKLPLLLEPYRHKIIVKSNLSFIDYHKEFLDAFCIMPLILKKTHQHYYTTKLTSTINYAKGYKLKCLIDKELQEIYKLPDVEIFNDEDDIVEKFENTLKEYYTN